LSFALVRFAADNMIADGLSASLNIPVLAFTLVLALFCGILFGIAPAIGGASSSDVHVERTSGIAVVGACPRANAESAGDLPGGFDAAAGDQRVGLCAQPLQSAEGQFGIGPIRIAFLDRARPERI
jgi:hypothetical protein